MEEHSGKIFDSRILSRLFEFTRPYATQFWLLVALTLLAGFLGPLRPYLIQVTIDRDIATGNMPALGRMILLMAGLLAVQSVAQYYQTYISEWLGQTIIRDIRQKLYAHIVSLKLRFFDTNQIGRLVTRNISDVETLSDVFSEGFAAMAGDFLTLIFILILMVWTDWRLALISLSMLPFLLVSTYIFKEKIKDTFNEVRSAVANLNTFVQEHITGMTIVQLFGAERREMAKFETINLQHRKANNRSVLYYSIYFPVAEVIGAIGTGLLVWYGAKQVLSEEVTLGTLVAFIMYINMFFRPIRTIADRFNTLQMGIVSTDRILKLLDNDETIEDAGTLTPSKLDGKVEFQSVHFAYDGEHEVLRGITLECLPGQSIALVGPTGAGKSSVVNLLTRGYKISSGKILVDGQPVESYPLTYLRSRIGVVLQDVFLFSGSVRYNVTLGTDTISDDTIWQAAELVGAAPFLRTLPGKLDYEVNERGASLSVGQRQLISFIRAMVYNPDILVLDEATSSVDSETEEMIQNAIARMMKGRSSIVIAHRLSTIRQADRIYVIEAGLVAESGTHEALLAASGAYAELYRMQFEMA
jgi:ATP-binding cassette, subfamily B, multidrug efflux pump